MQRLISDFLAVDLLTWPKNSQLPNNLERPKLLQLHALQLLRLFPADLKAIMRWESTCIVTQPHPSKLFLLGVLHWNISKPPKQKAWPTWAIVLISVSNMLHVFSQVKRFISKFILSFIWSEFYIRPDSPRELTRPEFKSEKNHITSGKIPVVI